MAKAKYQLGEDRSHVNAEGHAQMVGPSSGASLDIRRKAGNVSLSDRVGTGPSSDEVTAHRMDVNPKPSGFARNFFARRFLADNAVFCWVKSIVLQNKRIWWLPFPQK